MSCRLCALAGALMLLAGCMELESDKFQAHRDALERGHTPDLYRHGEPTKKRGPKKPVKQEVDEEEEEDADDEESSAASREDRFLSALERAATSDQ